jgi:hypothetical protein
VSPVTFSRRSSFSKVIKEYLMSLYLSVCRVLQEVRDLHAVVPKWLPIVTVNPVVFSLLFLLLLLFSFFLLLLFLGLAFPWVVIYLDWRNKIRWLQSVRQDREGRWTSEFEICRPAVWNGNVSLPGDGQWVCNAFFLAVIKTTAWRSKLHERTGVVWPVGIDGNESFRVEQ